MDGDHECKPPWTSDDIGNLWAGSILRWGLPGRVQCLKKRHERSGFRRTQVLPVGGHVAAALDHLAYKLILRELYAHSIQFRSALSTSAAQRVTVVALLRLKNERTLPLH